MGWDRHKLLWDGYGTDMSHGQPYGLTQNESQQGRKSNEICPIHLCICKEGRKKIVRVSMKKVVNKQKKQNPFQLVSV